jgi:hypothetical protein
MGRLWGDYGAIMGQLQSSLQDLLCLSLLVTEKLRSLLETSMRRRLPIAAFYIPRLLSHSQSLLLWLFRSLAASRQANSIYSQIRFPE